VKRLQFPHPLTPEAIREGERIERVQAELALCWRKDRAKKPAGEAAA